ncbi:uncharacterized protein LOC127710946 isoform X2 [Mytilus californianus]|uniref:uncharacterized protein LOC127710946 isoform X2 n=1 Tax=Mytilus californianus TaxID=6549 RepID=UPI002247F1A1|nr:uncharacterized protein LOC127710946 isoform X2 [Mytilus californianus]
MNTTILVDVLLVLLLTGRTVMALTWNVVNNPLIFGGDVIIKCHVDKKDCNVSRTEPDTRQWTGGQHYQLLVWKGGSKTSKYKMITGNASLDFDLLIRHFNESDLGYEYTCHCGFSVHTKPLSVEQNKLISFPTITKTDCSDIVNDHQLHIEVSLEKVNPLPNCTTLFKDKVICEANVTKLKSYGYFTDVNVSFTFPLQNIGCSGSLQIVCSLLSYNITVYDEYIQTCHEDDSSFHWHILLATACSVLLLTLLCIIYIIKRRQGNNESYVLYLQRHDES